MFAYGTIIPIIANYNGHSHNWENKWNILWLLPSVHLQQFAVEAMPWPMKQHDKHDDLYTLFENGAVPVRCVK